jgi:small subunit ribosomal protein S17e
MGRIKPKLVKRTSRNLMKEDETLFAENFEDNKKALGKILSSKKTRNKIAGYLVRLKKNTKSLIDNTEDGSS